MSCELPPSHERSIWEQERSWFNHHRLKNQFENHLGAFVSLLAGNLGAEPVSLLEFGRLRSEWLEIRKALKALANRFCVESGPCRFFSVPPLDSLPVEVKSWMEPLTREMWWRRIGGEELVTKVWTLVEACDVAFAELDNLVAEGENRANCTIHLSVALTKAGDRFHHEVHKLSEAFTHMKQRSYVDS
jgi:hypothetical protein